MNSKFKISQGSLLWYHIGAILTITAWGVSFVSTKVLLDHGLQPTEVYVYRTLLAYILILCVCHKRIFSNSLRDELLFVACGLCAGSLYFIAENTALEYTLVSNVSLIVTLSPLITTLLVGAIYKSEKPGKGVLAGSLVALFGVGFAPQAECLLLGNVYIAQDIFLWDGHCAPVFVHAVEPYAADGIYGHRRVDQLRVSRSVLLDACVHHMGVGQQGTRSDQGKQLPLFSADSDTCRVGIAARRESVADRIYRLWAYTCRCLGQRSLGRSEAQTLNAL